MQELKPYHWFQPLEDARWDRFLAQQPHSSVFHTAEWLRAVHRTYGYEPIAISTNPPGEELHNGIVFCRIESWLTGSRLVSVPFSDHCDLLFEDTAKLNVVLCGLERELTEGKLDYIELRSTRRDLVGFAAGETHSYCLHQIDLTPTIDTLYNNLHKDSTQRKIRRAQREGLRCEQGRSTSMLDDFYRLLMLTRRRHLIPPQPKKWFMNLMHCLGDALQIQIAFKGLTPIAGILTIRYKNRLLYKYGCSDAQFHPLGGMHLLLWRAIQQAKQDDLREFDLGRSDLGDLGLQTFKDRWGARRSELNYSRLCSSKTHRTALRSTGWHRTLAKTVFPHLSDGLLCAVGRLMYKHIG